MHRNDRRNATGRLYTTRWQHLCKSSWRQLLVESKYGIEYSLASASNGPCPHGWAHAENGDSSPQIFHFKRYSMQSSFQPPSLKHSEWSGENHSSCTDMVHLTTNGSTGPPGSQCRWQVYAVHNCVAANVSHMVVDQEKKFSRARNCRNKCWMSMTVWSAKEHGKSQRTSVRMTHAYRCHAIKWTLTTVLTTVPDMLKHTDSNDNDLTDQFQSDVITAATQNSISNNLIISRCR